MLVTKAKYERDIKKLEEEIIRNGVSSGRDLLNHMRHYTRKIKEIEARYDSLASSVKIMLEGYADGCHVDGYLYEGDWLTNFAYCSDRMNAGRAKAILRLMKNKHDTDGRY